MALKVSINFNLERVLRDLAGRGFVDGRSGGDGHRALHRHAEVALAREVATDMGLKVGVVKNAIRVETATVNRLTATVIAKGAKIPLIDFSARGPTPSRGRGRGVSSSLPSGRLPHAFIATMPGGHKGVFMRVPGGQRHGPAPHRSQLPIRELFGPSIAHVFQKHVLLGEERRQASLTKNVQHEIQFALDKAAKK